MSDTDRLERLEQLVRGLADQVAHLRAEVAEVQGVRPGAAPAAAAVAAPRAPTVSASPAPAAPPPSPPRTLDLEAFLGRYGAMAVATIAILVGVGAFLTWAIAHGLLGPVTRVVAGAIAAAALALVGWRLRARGAVRFGNAVLALALAVLQLDAWAAGPRLHVVPTGVALAAAFVASETLALFALRTGEEMLFVVGVGGALLAPFVAVGTGSAAALAGYGLIVIGAGVFGLRSDDWRLSAALLAIGGLAYEMNLGTLRPGNGPDYLYVAPIFVLVCCWLTLLWGRTRARPGLALWFLTLVVLGFAYVAGFAQSAASAVAVALAATLTSYWLAGTFETTAPARVLATVLPLAFLAGAELSLQHPDGSLGVVIAAAWTALGIGAAIRRPRDRGLHLMSAAFASAVAVTLALHRSSALCVVALAADAALWAFVLQRLRTGALALSVTVILVAASAWAEVLLDERTPFAYPPFLTRASLAALAVVLAWWSFARAVARVAPVQRESNALDVLLPTLAAAPAVAAFLWGLRELSGAFSPAIAAFLTIIYLALVGVGAIQWGKRRAIRPARLVGLGLAFLAGAMAVLRAWSFDAVALRVGSCVLVGLFVALVAYWYRDRGGEPARQAVGQAG